MKIFLSCIKNLDCIRYEGSFDVCVRRIFVNTAIEHTRKNKLTNAEINDTIENVVRDTKANVLDNLLRKIY
jgi:RNA polymerase sigma-70 factor (ECF subfamily)